MSLEGGSARLVWMLLATCVMSFGCKGREETRQVVQRMEPTPAAAEVASGEAAPEARAGSATPMNETASTRAPARIVDQVTSEELEAELNRLEAELGR